jgi:hypothetical protein
VVVTLDVALVVTIAMARVRDSCTWLNRLACRRRRKGRMGRVILWDSVVLLALLALLGVLSVEGLVSLLVLLRRGDWISLERVGVSSRLLMLILRRRRSRRRGREVLLFQLALLVSG